MKKEWQQKRTKAGREPQRASLAEAPGTQRQGTEPGTSVNSRPAACLIAYENADIIFASHALLSGCA
jgi:hypothetical protein